MWTGKEWIPAPPSGEEVPNQPSEQTINMQDSVIGGDVVHNTVINNDPTAVTSAVIAALQQMGMVGQSPTAPAAPPVPEVELPSLPLVKDRCLQPFGRRHAQPPLCPFEEADRRGARVGGDAFSGEVEQLAQRGERGARVGMEQADRVLAAAHSALEALEGARRSSK